MRLVIPVTPLPREANPLMLSPIGQIIVPASMPGSLVVDFIQNNRDRAAQLLSLT